MGNQGIYITCLTSSDDDAHLYASGESDRALCGQPVKSPTKSPGGRGVCTACAKKLLIRVFQQGGIGAIRVYKRARPSDAPHPIHDPEDEYKAHHPVAPQHDAHPGEPKKDDE